MQDKSVARDFPVVCVGGSAGGLDAYTRLLRHLPADMGVAIVIVNHLRTVATMLHQILPRYSAMPVELITERLLIQPNRVYIIPEQRDLHVLDGEFRLKPISKPRGWPDVITVFLRSLTQHWGGTLIAVIVSGYDGDGAASEKWEALPSRKSPIRPASQICLGAQSQADVSILFFRPRISLKRLYELRARRPLLSRRDNSDTIGRLVPGNVGAQKS